LRGGFTTQIYSGFSGGTPPAGLIGINPAMEILRAPVQPSRAAEIGNDADDKGPAWT
jgi:hypothetical protein